MGSIGAAVRASFGPYEGRVSEIYRNIFINLDAFGEMIGDGRNPANILEVGCGEGALVERMVKVFPEAQITGIDIMPRVGRLYSGPRDRVRLVEMDVLDLSEEEPGSFDLIVMCDVLHHIPFDLRTPIFNAVKKLLLPGGCFVFKDWERRQTPIHWAVAFADRCITGDTVHYLDLPELRVAVDACFGEGSIKHEETVPPWRHNRAFFVEA